MAFAIKNYECPNWMSGLLLCTPTTISSSGLLFTRAPNFEPAFSASTQNNSSGAWFLVPVSAAASCLQIYFRFTYLSCSGSTLRPTTAVQLNFLRLSEACTLEQTYNLYLASYK